MNSPHFKSLDESVTPTPTSLSLREWISLSCAISQVEKSSSGLPFVKENCCVNDTKNEMLEVLGVISVVLLENVVLNGSEKSLENSFCKRVVAHFLTLRPKIHMGSISENTRLYKKCPAGHFLVLTTDSCCRLQAALLRCLTALLKGTV